MVIQRQADEDGETEAAFAARRALLIYGLSIRPDIGSCPVIPRLLPNPGLKEAALGSSTAFNHIVVRCQQERSLPPGHAVELTRLL